LLLLKLLSALSLSWLEHVSVEVDLDAGVNVLEAVEKDLHVVHNSLKVDVVVWLLTLVLS
jgi:hypothetical protein